MLQINNMYTLEKRTSIRGRVIRGGKMGRELGFPTAYVNAYVGHLKSGVYGVVVTLKGNEYWGIMNIGVKPTFESTSVLLPCIIAGEKYIPEPSDPDSPNV